MAKSIREFDEKNDQLKSKAHSGMFWEHWFNTSPAARRENRVIEEHSIWEKAIHFGILAGEKTKA